MQERDINSIRQLPVRLFGFLIFLLLSFQSDRDELLWSRERPLTWNDFNGVPKKRFAVASTHYNILKSVSAKNDSCAIIKIKAIFFRNESWKKKEWTSEDVLVHEQKHFDIVEIFARKMRKAVNETNFQNYESVIKELNSIYQKFDKEMDVYQDTYDEETDGSMNGKAQRKWNAIINAELNKLEQYKATEIKVCY